MYKPTRVAGREPRRRRSEGREAAEPCPTVGPRCSSPGPVASLARPPQPHGRVETTWSEVVTALTVMGIITFLLLL
jgi:hypothetical protein